MKKSIINFIIFLTLFCQLLFTNGYSQTPGSIDFAFGNNGLATADISSIDDGMSVALQTDGKIIVAGFSLIGSFYNFAVLRFDPNGTIDSTFSSDGKVTTAIGDSISKAYSVKVQPDGKILVSGYYRDDHSGGFAIVRYNDDGSLDNTFGNNGIVKTHIGSNDNGRAIALQNNGKILVAGYSNYDFALVRYNIDGTLDNSFSSDGIVTTHLETQSQANSVVIQSDGKIIVGGDSGFYNITTDFYLVRYNIDGSIDSTFSSDGIVTTDVGGSDDRCFSIALQGDEKIIAAGCKASGACGDFAVVRYNSDGSLDSTFSNDGISTTVIMNCSYGQSVALQSDGKIVLAGFNSVNSNYNMAVARYKSDGTLDNTFSSDGISTTDIWSTDEFGQSVAIQQDGGIIVCGYGDGYDFALVRFIGQYASIGETDKTNKIKIYPNPFQGKIFVQNIVYPAKIELYDISGKLIMLQEINNVPDIELPFLINGFYFIKLYTNNGIFVQKMIKN